MIPKVLGQQAPSAATNTDIYTVPGSTTAMVSTITVANRSSVVTQFRIAVRPAGAAIANQHYIAYDVTIAGNGVTSFTIGLPLATTDVITVYNTLATLSFGVFGVENP